MGAQRFCFYVHVNFVNLKLMNRKRCYMSNILCSNIFLLFCANLENDEISRAFFTERQAVGLEPEQGVRTRTKP